MLRLMSGTPVVTNVTLCVCDSVCVFGIIRCEGGRAFSQLSVDGRNIIKIIVLMHSVIIMLYIDNSIYTMKQNKESFIQLTIVRSAC